MIYYGISNVHRFVTYSLTVSLSGPFSSQLEVTLQYPDIAVDQYGNLGFWTIIYNQVWFGSLSSIRSALQLYKGDSTDTIPSVSLSPLCINYS